MCKLLKSLYGLKRAPKQWHENFNETLIIDGFSSCNANRCVYTNSMDDGHVITCLYVNDMLIFGTCNDI